MIADKKEVTDKTFFNILKCFNLETSKKPTFYDYFKPIGIFCRGLGALPLSNLQDSNCQNLHFSYFSLPLAFTVVQFSIFITLTICFIDWSSLFELIAIGHPRYMWRCVLMSLIMIRSLMSCFYCATNSDGFVKLIKKLDEFDQKLMEVGVEDGRKSNFIELTVKPLVSYVIVLLVIVTDLIGFSKSIVNLIVHKNFRRCAFLVCSFNGVWQVMPILLFIYFVKVIRRNFVVINDIIYKLIPDGDFLLVEKVDTSKLLL
ncbi:hypothetical protein QE152_g40683 [Popillia japonica]|uniref:Gustatory receptor n=1 Tax=Popillia japonica TaxID=7064 RepID=A0AAW1HFP6_POPJA